MEIRERLDEMRRELEKRRQKLADGLDQLALREFTGEAEDGSVRVTIDGQGAVRGVRVAPQALHTIGSAELGRRVVKAAQSARTAYEAETSNLIERLTAGDADALHRLREGIRHGGGKLNQAAPEAEPEPSSIDAFMRELRRFREELPRWADALEGGEAHGESAGGFVRASCTASGEVARAEIDSYFQRAVGANRVNLAITEALQSAQTVASRLMAAHQESLRFMGLPIGEVVSGRRPLSDLLPVPARFSPDRLTISGRSEDIR